MKYLFLLFLVFTAAANSQTKDGFIGHWINTDKTTTIEIYKMEESYYGKIINSTTPKLQDLKNEIIIVQMRERNEKKLYGGTFYDILNNNQYEIKMKLIKPNQMVVIRANRIFPKKQYWNKI